ncbi:MAG: hypothetical protein ABI721_01015 [Candidatus Dojkabacteria bacterium]
METNQKNSYLKTLLLFVFGFLIISLVHPLKIIAIIPMFQARSEVYVFLGGVKATGSTDVNAANRSAEGLNYRDNIVNEKSHEMRNNYTAPTAQIPALYNNDLEGEWNTPINPNVDQIVYVWETRNGVNSWNGPTWVAGFKGIISQAEVTQNYKSVDSFVMEPVPTPVFQSSTFSSITLSWNGLWDNSQGANGGVSNNTVTGYTIYRSVNGGAYSLLTSVSQIAGGLISYTDNTATPRNNYKYQLGVKFSWTANPLGYYESIGRGPESSDMATLVPEPDRTVILGTAQSIVAGNKSAVRTLETRDSSGNTINVTSDTTIDLSSNSTGANKKFYSVALGACTNNEITSVLIPDATSQAQFCYYDEKTSPTTWTLTTHKSNPSAPSWSDGTQVITVTPAALASFNVSMSSPQKNRAVFTGINTATAIDLYGNIKTNFDASANNVTVSSSPVGLTIGGLNGGSSNLLNLAGDFTNGVANLTGRLVVSTSTIGSYTFTLNSADAKNGTSGGVSITASDLDHFSFSLNTPQKVDAIFTGLNTLSARDIDNNIVTSFDASLNNVTITESLDSGTVSGLGLGANNILNQSSDFTNGVANLTNKIKYIGGVGSHIFKATSGAMNVNSNSIDFTNGTLDKFALSFNSPQQNDTVFASATVTAQDKGNNTVLDFDASANNTTLSVDAGVMAISGRGSPVLNQNTDFTNGVATINNAVKFTGTIGTRMITATSSDGKNGSQNVNITVGSINSLKINNGSGSLANEINDTTITTDDSLVLWSAAYDVSGNFISNSAVSWSSTGTLDAVNFSNTTNISFAPTTSSSAGTISITDGSTSDATGVITVTSGNAVSFDISAPTTANAGVQFNLNSITAKDSHNNTALTYTGAHILTVSNASVGPSTGTPTVSISCSFTQGVMDSCAPIILVKTETIKLRLTDSGATGQSNDIVVSGGNPHDLNIVSPSNVTAGVQFNLTSIYANDTYGNVSSIYTGTKTINYSGPGNGPTSGTPSYTTTVDFVNGLSTTTLATTLYLVENIQVQISDGTYSGTSNTISVAAGNASSMEYVSGNSQSGVINSSLSAPLIVLIKDTFGNNKSDVTVNFAVTSGGGSVNPTNPVSDTLGQAQTTFTLGSVVGTENNVAEASVNGLNGSPIPFVASATVSVPVGIRIVTPPIVLAGVEFDAVISVVDAGQNTVGTYSGLKTINFTGPSNSAGNNSPSYPVDVTFDQGIATAKITLYKKEVTNLNGNIPSDNFSGSSNQIDVHAVSPSTFEVIAPSEVLIGTEFNLTSIKTLDTYKNFAPDYNGTKTLSYTGPGTGASDETPTYTTTVDFTNGIATTTLTTILVKAETVTLNVRDDSGNISGDSNQIVATFDAPFVLFYVSGNNQVGVVGQDLAQPIIVSVLDQLGNPATSKSVDFAIQGGGSVDNDSVPVSSDGSAQVHWTLGTQPGMQTLTASVNGISTSIIVNATAVSDNATTLDVAQNSMQVRRNKVSNAITICLKDQFGNPIATNLERTINLFTNSSTGQFGDNNNGPFNLVNVVIPMGQSCTQVYYLDPTIGNYTLTFDSTGIASDHLSIEVQPDLIVKISLSPASFTILNTQTKQLSAVAYNDLDEVISGITFSWEVTSSSSGTITQSGLYTPGQTVGTFNNNIKVSYLNVSAFATATITLEESTNPPVEDNPIVYVPVINTPVVNNPVTIDVDNSYNGTGTDISPIPVNINSKPQILSPKIESNLEGNDIVIISGTAQASKVIIVRNTNGNVLGSTTSDKYGYWKIEIQNRKFAGAGETSVTAGVLDSGLTSDTVTFNIGSRTLLQQFIDLFYF